MEYANNEENYLLTGIIFCRSWSEYIVYRSSLTIQC